MADRSSWTPGMRLERIIYDAGRTKEDVANEAGLARGTVYRMCSDKPAMLESWCAVAEALGMDASELVGRCIE